MRKMIIFIIVRYVKLYQMKYLVLFCSALLLCVNLFAQGTGKIPWGKWHLMDEPGSPAVITLIEKSSLVSEPEAVTITCIKQKGLRPGMAIWLPAGIESQTIVLRIGANPPLMLAYKDNEALIENGYYQNANEETITDVLKQLLESNEMVILFPDKAGIARTVPVALSQFHDIYAKLD